MSDNIAIEVSDYYRGYRYKVVLVDYGNNSPKWWNGYIELKSDDPQYDDYNDYPWHVHGGWTYGDGSWIGFDTCHASDNIEKCDRKYVTDECKDVIDQIIRSKNGHTSTESIKES